jgi:putative endonuclease
MFGWFRKLLSGSPLPTHLKRGCLGEDAALEHLRAQGLLLLARNYRGGPGEIDLILRDQECVIFVEVKTRSAGGWLRPAAAVNLRKRKLLSASALHYLRQAGNPRVRIRFDIVEVLLRGGRVSEVRHLANAFPLHGDVTYAV